MTFSYFIMELLFVLGPITQCKQVVQISQVPLLWQRPITSICCVIVVQNEEGNRNGNYTVLEIF